MTDNHITRAKAAAERAANSNKTAERESLALLAIADALIAIAEAGNGPEEDCAECARGLGEYADSLCDPLKRENAELRELCKAAFACAEHGSCDECRVTFGGCTLRTAMRELGIEVDG